MSAAHARAADTPYTEIKLLLAAARPPAMAEKQQWVELLPQLNWDTLLYEAHRHGLKPLLCHWRENLAPAIVPAAPLAELQPARQATLLCNLRLTGARAGAICCVWPERRAWLRPFRQLKRYLRGVQPARTPANS